MSFQQKILKAGMDLRGGGGGCAPPQVEIWGVEWGCHPFHPPNFQQEFIFKIYKKMLNMIEINVKSGVFNNHISEWNKKISAPPAQYKWTSYLYGMLAFPSTWCFRPGVYLHLKQWLPKPTPKSNSKTSLTLSLFHYKLQGRPLP